MALHDTKWHDLYIADSMRSRVKYTSNAGGCTILVDLGTSHLNLGMRSSLEGWVKAKLQMLACQMLDEEAIS